MPSRNGPEVSGPFLTFQVGARMPRVPRKSLLLNFGINGDFIDQADKGVEARDAFLKTH